MVDGRIRRATRGESSTPDAGWDRFEMVLVVAMRKVKQAAINATSTSGKRPSGADPR